MNAHLGVLLDWTVVDFVVLGFAVQQYVSISRDLKRTKARAISDQIESKFQSDRIKLLAKTDLERFRLIGKRSKEAESRTGHTERQ